MSAICQNFVQNAWKKDLCSNCFKSKEEHGPASFNSFKSKYTPIIKTSPNGVAHTDDSQPQSIMKNVKKAKIKRTVCFPKEESEIIGYGGEDWSDGEEFELSEESASDELDLAPDDDAERELQRLTKCNTDFNTVNANLLGESNGAGETRRTFAQLMLGKPQTDAEGKKQTLLVSVTPFGHDAPPRKVITTVIKPAEKNIVHIPIAKNKESIPETKTSVILTSFTKNEDQVDGKSSPTDEKSLLDEITETLEKNKSLVQMKNSKNEAQNDKENVPVSNDNEFIKTKAECVFINGDEIKKSAEPRKNGLTRHTAIKRDQEKPIIYQSLSLGKCSDKLTAFNGAGDKAAADNEAIVEATSPVLVKTECADKTEPGVAEVKFISEATANLCTVDATGKHKVLGLPPVSPLHVFHADASRELAGEPDGRSDSDLSEPPALPLTPPPLADPRPSFLHSPAKRPDKPKVPAKPSKVVQQLKRPAIPLPPQVPIEDADGDNTYESLKSPLSKQDSNGCDLKNNKRRAPKPPTPTPPEEVASPIYTRNVANSMKNDSPVVREKEKRERASSCSPKFRNGVVNTNPTGDSTPNLSVIPEPAPRRSLSLSQDSLSPLADKMCEKKKNKGRFSLKKFLRMGSSKDVEKNIANVAKQKQDEKAVTPQPKPRLVIVHPLELNGAEVLKSETCNSRRSSLKDDCNISISTSSVSSGSERDTPSPPRPCKPPPPPRNLDEWKDKPSRPPPMKHDDILRHQKLWNNNNYEHTSPKDNIYANVGEVRAAIMPSKPVRTASMREREAALLEAQHKRRATATEHNYESVGGLRAKDAENVYDFVSGQRSSSPECDSGLGKDSPPANAKSMRCRTGHAAQQLPNGEGSSPEYGNKFHAGFARATSLQYCGSETESEIYSPYSFYGSEADVGEEDADWSNSSARTCKLRSRKGRSIVHKNLEDNYGAVVVANHEALTQVLEHMHQSSVIQPALRGLKSAANLRWSDFSIADGVASVGIGRRCFHTALWGAHHVTLALTQEQGSMLQSNPMTLAAPITLNPITEFSDLVPLGYLPAGGHDDNSDPKVVQATIAVLPWMQVDTIQSMGTIFRSKAPATVTADEPLCREGCFILLQLVNGLKCLQAQGIEELPLSLFSFALCRDLERDTHPRLCLLQGLSDETSRSGENSRLGSLCECALAAVKELLPPSALTALLDDLLRRERAISLTQVKSVLEFTLWGPSDVALTTPVKDRELALQRWLDLERATVLHGLVRTRVQLTVFEEYHLLFLVRSSAKIMCEASQLLDSIDHKTIKC